MIPGHQPFTRLRHKAVALRGRAAGAVIHRVTALPLLFNRTLALGFGDRRISLGPGSISALIVGLVRAYAIVLYPEFEVLAIYCIVIAILLLRPAGIFGRSLA